MKNMQAPTNLVLPHTKGAAKSSDGELSSEEEEPGGHPHALVGQVMLHTVQVQHHAQQAPVFQTSLMCILFMSKEIPECAGKATGQNDGVDASKKL